MLTGAVLCWLTLRRCHQRALSKLRRGLTSDAAATIAQDPKLLQEVRCR
jgi:hypothetical protein